MILNLTGLERATLLGTLCRAIAAETDEPSAQRMSSILAKVKASRTETEGTLTDLNRVRDHFQKEPCQVHIRALLNRVAKALGAAE